MATQTIEIKAEETKAMKLSPAAFIPAMSFPISNATGIPGIRISSSIRIYAVDNSIRKEICPYDPIGSGFEGFDTQ